MLHVFWSRSRGLQYFCKFASRELRKDENVNTPYAIVTLLQQLQKVNEWFLLKVQFRSAEGGVHPPSCKTSQTGTGKEEAGSVGGD